MDKLLELGISEDNINFMLEQCHNIINISDEEITDKINILIYIGCTKSHIKNIITSNPYYLNRLSDDILTLINYLKKIGLRNINLLFDSNPYFLNLETFEIKAYIDNKLNSGIELDTIIDQIENNPYIITEDQ